MAATSDYRSYDWHFNLKSFIFMYWNIHILFSTKLTSVIIIHLFIIPFRNLASIYWLWVSITTNEHQLSVPLGCRYKYRAITNDVNNSYQCVYVIAHIICNHRIYCYKESHSQCTKVRDYFSLYLVEHSPHRKIFEIKVVHITETCATMSCVDVYMKSQFSIYRRSSSSTRSIGNKTKIQQF